MEYLLELLEGSDVRLRSGRRLSKTGVWDTEAPVEYEIAEEDAERTIDHDAAGDAGRAAAPGGRRADRTATVAPAATAAALAPASSPEKKAGRKDEGAGLTFDDPSMDWSRDDDPFADLGPIDPEGTDDPKPRGAGGPLRRR